MLHGLNPSLPLGSSRICHSLGRLLFSAAIFAEWGHALRGRVMFRKTVGWALLHEEEGDVAAARRSNS